MAPGLSVSPDARTTSGPSEPTAAISSRTACRRRSSTRHWRRLADKVKAAVDPIRGLNDQFREDPASHHWILSSNMSGLEIPIELLHVQRTPLCLHTGVARQIVEYPPPRNSRRTLAEALAELRHKGIRLRALLVGVDPDDELPVEEEIAGVEKEIEEGCARMDMAAPAMSRVRAQPSSISFSTPAISFSTGTVSSGSTPTSSARRRIPLWRNSARASAKVRRPSRRRFSTICAPHRVKHRRCAHVRPARWGS